MGGLEIFLLYVTSVMSVVFSLSIAVNKPKDLPTLTFLVAMISAAIWSLGIAVFLSSESELLADVAVKIYYSAAMLVAWSSYLNIESLMPKRLSKTLIIYSLIPALLIIVMIWLYSQIMIAGVDLSAHRPNIVSLNHIGYSAYSAVFIFYIVVAIASVVHFMLDKEKRRRYRIDILKYLIYSYAIAMPIGMIFNLILPGLGNYELIWVGPLCLFGFMTATYFAVARYGLYDLKRTAVRSVAYIITLLILSLIYYLIVYVVSIVVELSKPSNSNHLASPYNIALVLLMAYLFQPIKHFFDNFTDKVFFRGQYDIDDFLGRMSTIYTNTTTLDDLLRQTIEEIAGTIKASCAMYVVFKPSGEMVEQYTGKFARPADDILKLIHSSSFIEDSGSIVVSRSITEVHSHTKLGRALNWLNRNNIEIILPIKGGFGFLLLGEHKSTGYSRRDIRTLETVSGELGIAIQNAFSIDQVRDLNENLQKKVELATNELRLSNQRLQEIDETKDDFLSMASHQLRTPLTGVKGYLSMVLDGDAGKITSQQRKFLSEAFNSSERMVRLIGDFLNVSRLQTGKFTIDRHPTNLAEIVDQEVKTFKNLAHSHGMSIKYRKPRKNFPTLDLDGEKLRQVIMNFIDNAIYYSPAGSTVEIRLSARGGEVRLEVHDEGMGVPEADRSRVFTKFFRADNARKKRPDGTGVGLYLAKKIVDQHGGNSIFKPGKGGGSIFGFSLPIKKQMQK